MAETVLDRLVVKLGADPDLKGLRRFESGIDRVKQKMNSVGNFALKTGTALTVAAGGLLSSFASIQSKFTEFSSKTGISTAELKDSYAAAIREISTETGIAQTRIIDGFQKAISAGVSGADAIELVGKASKVEAAKIGSLEDAVSTATTALSTFGIEGPVALDKIARASQLGEGDAADYALSIKGLLQIAKPLGITFDELASTLAASAQQTKSVGVSETQIASFLDSIGAPTDKARKSLSKLTNGLVSFETLQARLKEEGGLADVIGTLQTLTNLDPILIDELIPRKEGRSFFNTILPQDIKNITKQVENADGTIVKAFGEGAKNVSRLFNITREKLRNLAQDIGETLAPAFEKLNGYIVQFIDWFNSLGPTAKGLVGKILVLGPVLIGVGLAAKTLAFALGGLAPVYVVLSSAAKAMGKIHLLTFASIKAGALGTLDSIKVVAARTFASISLYAKGAYAVIVTGMTTMKAALLPGFAIVSAAGRAMWLSILGLGGVAIAGIIAGALLLVALWKPVSTFFSGFFEGVSDGWWRVEKAFDQFVTAIDEGLDSWGVFGDLIRFIIKGFVGGFETIGNVWTWVSDLFGDWFSEGTESGTDFIDTLVFIIDLFKGIAEVVGFLIRLLTNPFDVVKEGFQAIGAYFNEKPSGEEDAAITETVGEGAAQGEGTFKESLKTSLGGAEDVLPQSDAKEGPLSTLTKSGRAIMETLSAGILKADPLSKALSDVLSLGPINIKASSGLDDINQVIKPIVGESDNQDDVTKPVFPVLEKINQVINPVLEALPNPDAINQTINPVVGEIPNPDETTQKVNPILDIINQIINPVVGEIPNPDDATQEINPLLETINQIINPILGHLPDIEAINGVINPILGELPDIEAITAPLPIGPLTTETPPAAQAASGGPMSITFNQGAIQINAEGADANELALSLRDEIRSAVEQAENPIRA